MCVEDQFPWSDSGKELLVRFELMIREMGGYEQAYLACTGSSNHVFWLDSEIESLIEQWNSGNLTPSLPNRSWKAIDTKLCILRKRGKLKSKKELNWSASEITYLVQCVTKKIKPVLPKRTTQAIQAKIFSLGLSRKNLK